MWRKTPDDVEVLTLPSGVGIRLFRPAGVTGQAPALLWIHGGGYVIGKAAQDDALCRRYAHELGATVASVDYRLAPEHPYPTPVEDCYSALQWLVRLPPVDRSRVAIGGGSAGGGLAAALALLTRDRAEISLAAQLLVYPMLDDRTVDRKGLDNPWLRLWNQSSNRYRLVRLPRRCGPAGGRARAARRSQRVAAYLAGRGHVRPVSRRGPGLRRAARGRRCAVRGRGRPWRIPRLRRHRPNGRMFRSRFSRASALCCGRCSHPRRPRPVAPAVG